MKKLLLSLAALAAFSTPALAREFEGTAAVGQSTPTKDFDRRDGEGAYLAQVTTPVTVKGFNFKVGGEVATLSHEGEGSIGDAKATVVGAVAQKELNLKLPVNIKPYVTASLGYAEFSGQGVKDDNGVVVGLGVGGKLPLSEKTAVGLEYRRLMALNADSRTNQYTKYNKKYDNWQSDLVTVGVTYKF